MSFGCMQLAMWNVMRGYKEAPLLTGQEELPMNAAKAYEWSRDWSKEVVGFDHLRRRPYWLFSSRESVWRRRAATPRTSMQRPLKCFVRITHFARLRAAVFVNHLVAMRQVCRASTPIVVVRS